MTPLSRPLFLAALCVATGCTTLGPRTITRDRFDYSAALSDSWKHQTLLNIVKLRYMDLPVFLDVGQIVAGYSFETGVQAAGGWAFPGPDSLTVGGTSRYTDRPTITYAPMTGDRFLRNMLEPFPPVTLFKMLQAGYQADGLFELSVASFNGLTNRGSGADAKSADPRFLRVLDLLALLQRSDSIGMRVEASPDGQTGSVITFRSPDAGSEVEAAAQELKSLLKLAPDATRYELLHAPVQQRGDQLAVRTRSLIQLLVALSTYVEVPEEDIVAGRAVAVPPLPEGRPPVLRVSSGDSVPDNAFFAVPFRDHWFWIDDSDLRSKRTFAFVMFLFTLTDTGSEANRPVLTIPTSG